MMPSAEHCMDPAAVGQPPLDKWHRIVETPAYRDCQMLSKPVHVAFAWKSNVRQLEPGTAIDEDVVRTVDQDVGHPGSFRSGSSGPAPTLWRRNDSTVSSIAESLRTRPSARMAVAMSTGE
jgi:hypothetical protein